MFLCRGQNEYFSIFDAYFNGEFENDTVSCIGCRNMILFLYAMSRENLHLEDFYKRPILTAALLVGGEGVVEHVHLHMTNS